jgi:hypothetical protein
MTAPRPCVRRTLELSCEAPIVPGFVSFNSLFAGSAATPNRERPHSEGAATEYRRCTTQGSPLLRTIES